MSVETAPGAFRCEQQLEGHREAGGARAGALGDALTQLHRGEGGLDGVGRPQMLPVLGREVEVRDELVAPVHERRCRLRVLRPRRSRRIPPMALSHATRASARSSLRAASPWPSAGGSQAACRARCPSCAPSSVFARRWPTRRGLRPRSPAHHPPLRREGPRMPRFFRSRSTSCQLSFDSCGSRPPTATTSLVRHLDGRRRPRARRAARLRGGRRSARHRPRRRRSRGRPASASSTPGIRPAQMLTRRVIEARRAGRSRPRQAARAAPRGSPPWTARRR